MELQAFIDELIEVEGEGDLAQCDVFVLVEGQPPLQINHVEPEFHEDSRTTTIWIRAEST